VQQQPQQQQQRQQGYHQQGQQPSPETEPDSSTSPVDERSNLAWNCPPPQDSASYGFHQGFAEGLYSQGSGLGRTANESHDDHSGQLDFTFSAPDLPSTGTSYDDLDYEQIFQPDTASSFNMPYTTAFDYGWLFNNAKETASQPIPQRGQGIITSIGPGTHDPQPFSISPPSTSSQLWSLPSDSGFGDAPGVVPGNNSCGGQDSPPIHTAAFGASMSAENTSLHQTVDMLGGNTASSGQSLRAQVRKQQQQQKQQHAPDLQRIHISERPFSTLDGSINVPKLDEESRKVVLETIASCGPSLPNGADASVWQLPLLSLESLQEYLELFFTRFNTAYPLIHLPTFTPDETEPLLLIAILLLGATYSTKDAHQVAVCIHDVIRPRIFAHAGFSAKPQWWSLQTILLVECFGKSRAGLKQHEMSHLFHGLLINLIRRSNCQSVKPQGPVTRPRPDYNEDSAWRQWAAQEEQKR
jgi:hypothetical protein